jgi:hypothetical protein
MSTTKKPFPKDLEKAYGMLGIPKTAPIKVKDINATYQPIGKSVLIQKPMFEEDDDLVSIQSIIDERPKTKEVRDFFRENLEELDDMED